MLVDLTESTFTFGRAPNCTLQIDKQNFPQLLNVSKVHFQIVKEDDMVYLIDLSKNGTFINSEKVGRNNRHIISDGDIISIGHPSTRSKPPLHVLT